MRCEQWTLKEVPDTEQCFTSFLTVTQMCIKFSRLHLHIYSKLDLLLVLSFMFPSLFLASKPCCLGSLLKSFIPLASHLRVVWCSQGCLSGSKFLPALSCTLPITPWRLFHGISTGTNAAPGLHTGFASTKSAVLLPYTGPMRGVPVRPIPGCHPGGAVREFLQKKVQSLWRQLVDHNNGDGKCSSCTC